MSRSNKKEMNSRVNKEVNVENLVEEQEMTLLKKRTLMAEKLDAEVVDAACVYEEEYKEKKKTKKMGKY